MLTINHRAKRNAPNRVRFIKDWSLALLGSAHQAPIQNHVISADACRLQEALLRKGKK